MHRPCKSGSRWIANGYTHLDGVSDACQITAGSRPRGVEGESLACARVRAKQRGRGSGREGRRPGPIAMSSTRGAGYRRTRSSLACARVRAIERGRRSRRPGTGAIRTQHRPSTTCSFETVPTSLTHGFKPFSRHLVRLDGRTWDRTRERSQLATRGLIDSFRGSRRAPRPAGQRPPSPRGPPSTAAELDQRRGAA
jgi:hypothetical protein